MEPSSQPQRRDASFRRFVELSEEAEALDVAVFIAGLPDDIQGDVGAMIADYTLLSSTESIRPELIAGLEVDDFQLVKQVGTGGAGVVWCANQKSIDRFVALKFLRPELITSPVAVERFRREAQAAGRLSHPRIVHVFGDGIWHGLPYIVLEYVEGQVTLIDWIESQRALGQRSSEQYLHLADIFRQIAEGLVHAHARGVIHRDVKPANILIDGEGRPLVADFGTALIQERLHLTRTGDFFGTPFYMSPEQAASQRMGIDHRTDVFSLSATFYEALSLTRAFDGDTSMQVFTKILTVDPPDPRTLRSLVPRDLAIICMKALEKTPTNRYASMELFRDDLVAFIEGRNIQARPPTRVQRMRRAVRRNPRAMTAAAVTGVLMVPLALMWNGRSEALAASRDAETRVVGITHRLTISAAWNALEANMDRLWPLSPASVAAMEDWIQRATKLEKTLGLLNDDEADFKRGLDIREVGANVDRNEAIGHTIAFLSDPTTSSGDAGLIQDELERTRVGIQQLSGPDGLHRSGLDDQLGPGIDRRLKIIETAQWLSADSPEAIAAWQESSMAIAGDSRFEGFELQAIFGLVPLGADPQSGLLEFADATTGEVPVRDPDSKTLSMTSASGLVFVLIPGGQHWIGAQSNSPSEPHYDPEFSPDDDQALVEVTLDPFLISKYEMHQMAFARLAGFDPSVRKYHSLRPTPVESVSYDNLVKYLWRAELGLPTHAQWEVAARGGTDTRWFFGTDDGSEDLCNVGGLEAQRDGHSWLDTDDEDGDWRSVDDGYIRTAPIDSMRPNPYGLHHVHGNVNEVCVDEFAKPGEDTHAPRIGDGLIEHVVPRGPESDPIRRVYKGATFHSTLDDCRIVHLQRSSSSFADNGNGVRPLHPIPYLKPR